MGVARQDGKVTIEDICKVAGVSSATVSRVVNGSPLVVPRTREKVERAIKKLGYTPNFAARMLVRNRTDTVAVLIPPLGRYFFGEAIAAMDEEAREKGYHIIVALAHSVADEVQIIQRYAGERRADGLIVMALHKGLDAPLRAAATAGMPLSVVGRNVKHPRVSSTALDNASGARQVVEHLASKGCRRLALIAGNADNLDSIERLKSAVAAAERQGIQLDQSVVISGDFRWTSGYKGMLDILKAAGPRPDGVFAFNDDMALGALAALREQGLNVPRDILLAGFDNLDVSEYGNLTTVACPVDELGRASMSLLLDRLEHPDAPAVRKLLPVQLVVRSSTGG